MYFDHPVLILLSETAEEPRVHVPNLANFNKGESHQIYVSSVIIKGTKMEKMPFPQSRNS